MNDIFKAGNSPIFVSNNCCRENEPQTFLLKINLFLTDSFFVCRVPLSEQKLPFWKTQPLIVCYHDGIPRMACLDPRPHSSNSLFWIPKKGYTIRMLPSTGSMLTRLYLKITTIFCFHEIVVLGNVWHNRISYGKYKYSIVKGKKASYPKIQDSGMWS